MTKISICIPIETATDDPLRLVTTLLADPAASIEIVAAGESSLLQSLKDLSTDDPRLKLLPLEHRLARQRLWRRAVEASTGDWVTLINPADMIEIEIENVATYVESTAPETDAIAWTAFQIAASAKPETAGSVAIPASYHITLLDKTVMLESFFYWDGSLDTPKVPFGLFHGLLRRSLVDTLLQLPENAAWSTPVPQYEWTTKALLFASELAFCARPLSAIDIVPFQPPRDAPPVENFPLHAGLGITAAIAEVQYNVLAELGSVWGGGVAAFVRACMIDCMKETDPAAFNAKCNGYFAALKMFHDTSLAEGFQPRFAGERAADRRRGLHGEALLVDRFIGGARTAQDFFAVMRGMIAPIGLICGGVTK